MDVFRVTVEQDGPTRFGYTYAACQHRQEEARRRARAGELWEPRNDELRPHWADCPEAKQWKGQRRKGRV